MLKKLLIALGTMALLIVPMATMASACYLHANEPKLPECLKKDL